MHRQTPRFIRTAAAAAGVPAGAQRTGAVESSYWPADHHDSGDGVRPAAGGVPLPGAVRRSSIHVQVEARHGILAGELQPIGSGIHTVMPVNASYIHSGEGRHETGIMFHSLYYVASALRFDGLRGNPAGIRQPVVSWMGWMGAPDGRGSQAQYGLDYHITSAAPSDCVSGICNGNNYYQWW